MLLITMIELANLLMNRRWTEKLKWVGCIWDDAQIPHEFHPYSRRLRVHSSLNMEQFPPSLTLLHHTRPHF